jgi:hypothetical protein
MVRYYGWYSNNYRGMRLKRGMVRLGDEPLENDTEVEIKNEGLTIFIYNGLLKLRIATIYRQNLFRPRIVDFSLLS